MIIKTYLKIRTHSGNVFIYVNVALSLRQSIYELL